MVLSEKKYPIGLAVIQFDWDKNYTITGNLAKSYQIKDFDSAYDFEEYVQKHVDCTDIDFDSEFSQFFAYAKTEERAIKFVEDITVWFDKVKQLLS